MFTARHYWKRHSQLLLGTIRWRYAYIGSLRGDHDFIFRRAEDMTTPLYVWLFRRLENMPQIFQSSFCCFLLIIIILYNSVCTAEGMCIEYVREALRMQKERMTDWINNLQNYTYNEIGARENMVSGGTVNLLHSYKTLCNSSSSPRAISVCTVLSLKGLGGYRDHAMKYVAQNQTLLGHKQSKQYSQKTL